MNTYSLPPLPYPFDALEPAVSKETLEYHYGKHHKGYVDKLNQLVAGTPWENDSLENVIRGTFEKERKIFNQAAQVWNHNFLWNSLSPTSAGGGKLESSQSGESGALKTAIERDFGDFEKFKESFSKAALGLFGSGWAWVVCDELGTLGIRTTSNADNPLRKNEMALLTCDVWEHAYYIDYRNARAKYLENIWSVLNWKFAAQNYSGFAKKAAA